MAEALVNARLGEKWQAFSAGTHPAGYVHPKALTVLSEIEIQHQGRSKSVEEFRGQPLDLVVTVCDAAADECPVWLGPEKRIHVSFQDPAKAIGTDEQILKVFRAVRDEMIEKLLPFLETFTLSNAG